MIKTLTRNQAGGDAAFVGSRTGTGRMRVERLVSREREALQQANALARRLVTLRTHVPHAGSPLWMELERLQEQHRMHLGRCLRLRSHLATLQGG